ncbi:hypothetical protein NQ318_018073 [Aromia moschata]|uniref:CHK kinase-like domain-containing protein n=1 Tax=Aromia moschata TaxID=1265417 RepID=A0AAV8ZD26_9CUCU|nr:hypothetical protein NQ318_018073 [Aromia moschata]
MRIIKSFKRLIYNRQPIRAVITDCQGDLIKKIADSQWMKNYKLETRPGSTPGTGILSTITAVSLISDPKKLDLILKSAEADHEIRKKFPIRKANLREMHVYEDILPEFESFQREYGVVDEFTGLARIYGMCDKENEECLILENLSAAGYKMWNTKISMTPSHISLGVCEYAKFHAVSLAMRDKKPRVFTQLTANLDDVFEAIPKESLITALATVYPKDDGEVNDKVFLKQAIKKACDAAEKYLKEDLNCSEDKIAITHADCWSNNMMFKYDVRCGDKTRTQKRVCEIFNTKYPYRRISQSAVSRIENIFREFGNVTDIPKSGRKRILDDEQKLEILLDIQDNPHNPTRQVAVDNDLVCIQSDPRLSLILLCLVKTYKHIEMKILVTEYRIIIKKKEIIIAANKYLTTRLDPEHAEKPTKVCLFDWQLSKMGSPVMDLADFLFVNGSKQVLDDHKKYLKLYHDTLSSNLKQFRCDPNVFSASMFEHHWQKYAKNGLYAALFFIKLMLSEPEEIPDLHDIVGSGKIADRMNFSSSRHEEYRQRILDIISI